MKPSSMPWPCDTQRLRVHDLDIDLRYRRLSTPEQEAELPRRIFDLFLLLLAEPHRLHRRSELFARIWPGVIVEDANLSHSIWLLRRALGGARRHWIRTVAKAGYVFEPPARVEIAAAVCVGAEGDGVAAGRAVAVDRVHRPRSAAGESHSHWQVVIAAVLLALALALWWQRLSPLPAAAATSGGGQGSQARARVCVAAQTRADVPARWCELYAILRRAMAEERWNSTGSKISSASPKPAISRARRSCAI